MKSQGKTEKQFFHLIGTDNSSACSVFLYFPFFCISVYRAKRPCQAAARWSTDNFDHNEARREDNCDKSPSARRFEVYAGWLCVRVKWGKSRLLSDGGENSWYCLWPVWKWRSLDFFFSPHMYLNGNTQQRFSACFRVAVYINSNCYFCPSGIFRSFFSPLNNQQKMMIVIAGLSLRFLQLSQTTLFRGPGLKRCSWDLSCLIRKQIIFFYYSRFCHRTNNSLWGCKHRWINRNTDENQSPCHHIYCPNIRNTSKIMFVY